MRRWIACLVCLLAIQITASAADTPNFVVIFIDDMGYGDIEPFGSTINNTPNLNDCCSPKN